MVYFCHLSNRTAAPLSASISDLFSLGSQEACAYKMVVGATVVAGSLGGFVPDRMLTLSVLLWYFIIVVNVVISSSSVSWSLLIVERRQQIQDKAPVFALSRSFRVSLVHLR